MFAAFALLLTILPCLTTFQADLQDAVEDSTVYYDDDDVTEDGEKTIRPWLIVPITIPRVTKRALTVLSRWRPMGNYIEAAAAAVAASVSGPPSLDFVSAETRGHKSPGKQRTRMQPLRWGRRKRLDVATY